MRVDRLLASLSRGGSYWRGRTGEACAGETCAPESGTRRTAKPLLWLATLGVAALALFPSYRATLIGTPKAAPQAAAASETAEFKIMGMSCEGCAGVIQKRLLETVGVVQAEVHYLTGTATVKYDPARIHVTQLIQVINATGYKASILSARSNGSAQAVSHAGGRLAVITGPSKGTLWIRSPRFR